MLVQSQARVHLTPLCMESELLGENYVGIRVNSEPAIEEKESNFHWKVLFIHRSVFPQCETLGATLFGEKT